MAYFDGFLAPVPTANKAAYKAHAERAWPVFKALGALSMMETWGDDLPDGKVTSFPMAVKKAADESVVFSWIVWPDKATRDAAWARIMHDPQMGEAMGEMPFDGKRMIYGGFAPLLAIGAQPHA